MYEYRLYWKNTCFEIIYFDESLKNMLAQKKEIKQNFKTLLEMQWIRLRKD